jgi:prepilin-type N-terminal cleavage/methylation domain-containing protein
MGFTLIELVLAIAIAGIITGGITMTIFQVINGNIRTSNHMTAVRQVQNAGYWVSLDAQMAKEVGLGATSGFPLTLNWIDWDGMVHRVTYTLDGTELWRDYNGQLGPVAQFINPDPAKTSCDWDGSVLTFTVTATVQEQTETRIYEVIPRPG